jgi:Polysaccharide pyruvyl transferase
MLAQFTFNTMKSSRCETEAALTAPGRNHGQGPLPLKDCRAAHWVEKLKHRFFTGTQRPWNPRSETPVPQLGLFDPGIEDNEGVPSSNLGDLIIQSAVDRELRRLFEQAYWLRISTHVPMQPEHLRGLRNCQHLFVGGTNLLTSKMRSYKQWKITWRDAWRIRRAILLGVGWWQYQEEPDWHTRFALRGALSSRTLHSVRDEYTRKKLASIGIINVVNTGCPTMWPLAGFDSDRVPAGKSDTALVMLTDYMTNPELDSRLLTLVTASYKRVYLWPQGRKDLEYVATLNIPVTTLRHSLAALNEFLQSGIRFDYIGTRLHGGVHCLLAGNRTLILELDNRAREIARDTGLPTAARDDFDFIRRWITGPTGLRIKMNTVAIEQWRSQFRDSAVR